jgi:hypothetical protein
LKKDLQKSLRTILNLKSNEIEYIFDINKHMNKNLLTFPRYHIIKSCMLLRVSMFICGNLLFIKLHLHICAQEIMCGIF